MPRLLLFLLPLLLLVSCTRWRGDEIARVNGSAIALDEFRSSCELSPQFSRQASAEDALRQQLDYLFGVHLGAAEARRRGLHRQADFMRQRQWREREEARDELYRQIIRAPVQLSAEEINQALRLRQYELRLKYLWSDSRPIIEEMRRRLLAGESYESIANRHYGKDDWKPSDFLLPEVTWGDLDETLEKAAFSLQPGEISQPIPQAGGYYLLQLENFRQNLLVTETDVRQQRPAVERRLRQRQEARAAAAFVSEFMGAQQLRVRAPAFNFLWRYARRRAGLQPSSSVPPNPELLFMDAAGELGAHLQDTLVAAKDVAWTIENFLARLQITPPKLRPNLLHPQRFRGELQKFILNEFLTDLAYKRNLQQSPAVQKAVAEWESAYLFAALQRAVLDTVRVSPRQVETQFQQHPELHQIPEKRQIREIFAKSPERIKLAESRLQAGEDFARLAQKYSERQVGANGALAFLTMQELGEIGPQVFNMRRGEISPPLKAPEGHVIVQLLEIQPSRPARLEEVASAIENELRQKRHWENWRNLLQSLRTEASVKINESKLRAEAKNFDPRKTFDLYGVQRQAQ
jgi:parvulin-like peptidyl-prolyl isomerase